ncbi:MAG TPA: M50 family metallopeptidase [Urbifossiella sp.]|nr:M50 family metallopeptidase [Urbifossiella sp.]
MYDVGAKHRPLSPQERWLGGIFLAVFLGLLVAEIFHDYQPVKLSALLIILFWIPLLALHEAGHAVAAALLNWHVGQVVIGVGRLVGSFRVGTAVVEIRLVPIEGFVKCVPKDLRHPRLKSACIYFAGPGVELLLAVVILLVVGPDRLLAKSDDYIVIGWQSLAIAAAVQGVLNLIPQSLKTPGGEIPNDGLGIILSFLRPDRYYADMIGGTYNEQTRDWDAYDSADWWKRGK